MEPIFICDDDKVYAKMLGDYLDFLGYPSRHCQDVDDLRFFMRKVQSARLVILDMQMGGGGGPAAAAVIPTAIPIIVVSGMPVEQQRVWFEDRLAIRFFQKPVHVKILGEAVVEMLPRTA